MQEEGLSATDNRHQPLSETFQQPDKIECDTDTQSESCLLSDATSLCTSNDNPLQLVFPNSSFSTLALDRDGRFDQVRSAIPDNCSYVPETTRESSASAAVRVTVSDDCVDRREMSDIIHDSHCRLGSAVSDQECTVTSDDVLSMDSESNSLYISSSRTINICRSSHENSHCYVCGQPQSQLQHHLKSVHAKEKEVIQLASLPTVRARIQKMVQLRNYGNHRHNQKVMQAGRGTLLVLYHPNIDAKPEDFSPCNMCWSYLNKAQLLRHRCQFSVQKRGRPKKHMTGFSNPAPSSVVASDSIFVGKLSKPGGIRKAHGIQVVSYRAYYGCKEQKSPCYFCGGWFSRVQRHWHAKHLNIPEVKKLLSVSKTDKNKRAENIARLRHLAIHEHNVQVLKQGHGQMFVSRYSKHTMVADYHANTAGVI